MKGLFALCFLLIGSAAAEARYYSCSFAIENVMLANSKLRRAIDTNSLAALAALSSHEGCKIGTRDVQIRSFLERLRIVSASFRRLTQLCPLTDSFEDATILVVPSESTKAQASLSLAGFSEEQINSLKSQISEAIVTTVSLQAISENTVSFIDSERIEQYPIKADSELWLWLVLQRIGFDQEFTIRSNDQIKAIALYAYMYIVEERQKVSKENLKDALIDADLCEK